MNNRRRCPQKLLRTSPWRNHHRAGAATVEFALVAGILFMFIFAALEFSRVNSIRNTTEIAAYEGARAAVIPGGTPANAVAATNRWLATVGVTPAEVTVTPAVIAPETESVKVRVRVQLDSNTWGTDVFINGMEIVRECELTRERYVQDN